VAAELSSEKFITGVSDDDPSGIATYSQCGAQFGFGMLWTLLFSFPLMVGIQIVSAHLGRVTGRGIAGNIRRHFPKWVLYPVVFILFAVNSLNLGADIQAMAACLRLLIPGSLSLYCIFFAVSALILEIFVPYTFYVRWLKWLTFAMLAYVEVVFVLHVNWGAALKATLIPRFTWNFEQIKMLTAVLGTTISPYLFFWQASQEVEEQQCHEGRLPLKQAPEQAKEELSRIRVDTLTGMGISNLIAFFIMLTTAVTLHAHGVIDIKTAAEAAEALRPVAGKLCFLLFSLGLIGVGMLAVPVLAGSAAYAISEGFHWRVGLERKPKEALHFYAVIAVSTTLGLGLTLLHIDPIKALIWTAVLNGVISAPIMAIMMIMASNRKIMGDFSLSFPLKVMGWGATLVMFLCSVILCKLGV
jgi:NRAMP (natural resistance-associated macrophage protein)-like metal ion transporter